jgi:ADP-heptose:LPS heptosyltransferase
MNHRYLFVSLKAYGDLVITKYFMNKIHKPHDFNIDHIISSHLSELYKYLNSDNLSSYLTLDAGSSIPGIYNFKKTKALDIFTGIIRLRASFSNLSLQSSDIIIFDRISFREKLLNLNCKISQLPLTDNIYLSYHKFFYDNFNIIFNDSMEKKKQLIRNISIFPSSRVFKKQIPGNVINRTLDIIRSAGFKSTVYFVRGDVIPTGIKSDITLLDSSFSILGDAIKGSDIVISADSLPAHLAEFNSIPTFVLSFKDNHYWLPLSSFLGGFCSNFDNINYENQLLNFLSVSNDES